MATLLRYQIHVLSHWYLKDILFEDGLSDVKLTSFCFCDAVFCLVTGGTNPIKLKVNRAVFSYYSGERQRVCQDSLRNNKWEITSQEW